MKGFILDDFVDFAAHELDQELPGGPWEATGTYPDEVLLGLVDRVATDRGVARTEILGRFGAHLFGTFAKLYPVFFVGVDSALELLRGIETWVHGEVKKLYPDAHFPGFEVRSPDPASLEMTYRSARPLADLAEGLIRGCVGHFGDHVEIARRDIDGCDGRAAVFTLRAGRSRTRRS